MYFITQQYSVIGRDRPSVCESTTAVEMNTNSPLPQISEECITESVFSTSVTSEEMLAYICGNNSSCKKTEAKNSAVDSGFNSRMKYDHTNKTSSPRQDLYMLEKSIVHVSSKRVRQQKTPVSIKGKIATEDHHHSCTDDNDSVLSVFTPSDNGSDGDTEIEHPDHYATIPQNSNPDSHILNPLSDDTL